MNPTAAPKPVAPSAPKLDDASAVIQKAINQAANDDILTSISRDTIEAFAKIQKEDVYQFEALLVKLKQANPKVSPHDVRRLAKMANQVGRNAPTHHVYAASILESFKVDDCPAVAHEGVLHVLDPDTQIWVRKSIDDVASRAAELHDGMPFCTRASDYKQIAEHAVGRAANAEFFADAPIGIAFGSNFFKIDDDAVKAETLTPQHRQRVRIDFEPQAMPTPLFDRFLVQTFERDDKEAQLQQIQLLQEIAGAMMTGMTHRYHKAVLFYDPFGRAGKGTMETILRSLVPSEYVVAVSPVDWDKEYYLLELAGARLNVVGELPESKRIPADKFKSVLGGDLVTGRHPHGRPVRFKNQATHLFLSNNLLASSENGEAFYARWLIIEFPNSLIAKGLQHLIDPQLADRIIEQEMPGIAQWALEGAHRLLKQGYFSKSSVSDGLIEKSRRSNDTIEEFLEEKCDLGPTYKYRRSKVYECYRSSCEANGRKPLGKARFKEALEHKIGIGVRSSIYDGIEIFNGLRLKPFDLGLEAKLAELGE